MKYIYRNIILFSTVLSFSCAAQKENKEVLEITYEAQTRGHSETILYKQNTLVHKVNTSQKEHVLSDKNQKSLREVVSKIKVVEISKLKAPSERRIFDGAMTTTISIKKGEKTYTSSSFDHDNPPKALKPLITLLKNFLK